MSSRRPIEGIDYPMYGEYRCPACHKVWDSSKAWRNYGQKCKSCNDDIRPHNLERLLYYNCKSCEKSWKHKKRAEGMLCKSCSTRTYPVSFEVHKEYVRMTEKRTQADDEKRFESKNPSRGHRQDLCEKCQKYGVDCSTVEYRKRERERQQEENRIRNHNEMQRLAQRQTNQQTQPQPTSAGNDGCAIL